MRLITTRLLPHETTMSPAERENIIAYLIEQGVLASDIQHELLPDDELLRLMNPDTMCGGTGCDPGIC